MPKINLLNVSGEQVGEVELNDSIFNIEVNGYALHAVVKNYLANQRQGTQSAKTRGEVRGGGRKPWRQKGTGRARQGSTNSPNWVGGGIVFAPKPRSYRYSISKKLKRIAMKSALTSKVQESEVYVLDTLALDQPKTKEMIKILGNLKAEKKTLIVTAGKDENVIKSASNIPGVTTTMVGTLNVYDILNHNNLIMTKDSVEKIEEVYA